MTLSPEGDAARVGKEAKPVEILEDRGFKCPTASQPVVILDPQQDTPTGRASDSPDIDRVHHVPQMQVPCWRRGKPGNRSAAELLHEPLDIWTRRLHVSHMIPWLQRHDPFPPVEQALRHPNGLLAAGADLSSGRLLDAYRHGVFPWFNDGEPVLWWSPDPRMVLYVNELHLSRSLRRALRGGRFRVTCDRAFRDVMKGCAEPRQGQDGTWISAAMEDAYDRLAALGYAHSVEAWEGERLAGGLYGVALGRMFFGESMFSRQADASKVALAHLTRQLERWGFVFIDCQMSTPHLRSLGAREVPRAEFVQHVGELVRAPAIPPPWLLDEDPFLCPTMD